MVYTIIIIFLSAADQLIKALINQFVSSGSRIVVIDRFFYLVNRKNSGAAWSFLAQPSWGIYVLAAVSAIVTVILLIAIYRINHRIMRLSLSLVCAGSIGNLIDRIRLKAVTDYLDFHFGQYVFPTFNLADMLIVCGTGLLIFLIISDHQMLDQPLLPWQPRKDSTHAKDPDC